MAVSARGLVRITNIGGNIALMEAAQSVENGFGPLAVGALDESERQELVEWLRARADEVLSR